MLALLGIALLGGWDRRALLLLAGAVVGLHLVAATTSSDLLALAPLSLVGWLLLAWLTGRPAARAWLAADAHPSDS